MTSSQAERPILAGGPLSASGGTAARAMGVTLEQVLVTQRLTQRATRAPDHAAENRALHRLGRAMSESPQAALDALVREALGLCQTDGDATAGVSLLELDGATGEGVFRWTAMAGRLAHGIGGTMPRGCSACGVCLDHGGPVLFDRPDSYFTYAIAIEAPFIEGLVLPFRVEGMPAGTIWIVSHTDTRRFDAEDVRVMTSLADFTGAVYAMIRAREAALQTSHERARLLMAEHSARQDAETANRAKSEFLAIMSHELRTPLNAIGGYAELIALGVHGPVTEAQHDAIERIQKSRLHLQGLINEVLNYARVERGAVRYDLRRVALRQTFVTCEALTLPQVSAKRLTLDIDCVDAEVAVHADEEKLHQILLNLLTNAVKFTEPGGRIGLRCDPGDGVVAVQVTDTGCGISVDHLTRIFEPFTQLDARLTRTHDGVGLGLAISRDLARAMGGDLTVQSTVDAGSTFTLTLPSA